jgi:hypothetical protein
LTELELFDGSHFNSGTASIAGLDKDAPRLTAISRLFSDLVNLIA